MITPMTRYQFLLYHSDVETFLARLRELGMVDITLAERTLSEREKVLFDKAELYKKVGKQMRGYKSEGGCGSQDVGQVVAMWSEVSARIEELESSIHKAEIEIKDLEKWGEFDEKLIVSLQEKGLEMRFFECSNKDFKSEWENEYALDVVAKDEYNTYFVVVLTCDQKYVDLPAKEIRVPVMSAARMGERVKELEEILKQKTEQLQQSACYSKAVLDAAVEFEEQFDFSRVMSAGENLVDDKVRFLEGWCEKDNTQAISEFAKQQDLVFTVEDAKIEQNPPIKLKNKWFSGLFEIVGKLYMLPRYDELDLTPFFAPFFMIFFGMCFGDAGYGLLILLALAFLWKKIPANFKSVAWLVVFLNISAVVFGALSGNVCGIELVKIEALSNFKQYFALSDPNTVFYFAIFLGAVQVLFGQILRIFNRMKRGGGFVYGVSSIGWVTLFISSIVAFLTDQTSEIWFYCALGLAGIMIVFFANPKANIFASAGKGLYSVYEMATGVVGDLISYVRLFAIGLAGAIIAQVFNELALGLSGDIIIVKQIVMAVILIFGHGLNIFISMLGAFVHPVRLTFVEFYKNAEFEGGGREFNPLKRRGN